MIRILPHHRQILRGSMKKKRVRGYKGDKLIFDSDVNPIEKLKGMQVDTVIVDETIECSFSSPDSHSSTMKFENFSYPGLKKQYFLY